jgi:hypothetical protein
LTFTTQNQIQSLSFFVHPVFSRNAAAAFHYQIFVSNSAKNASHGEVRKLKKSFD